MTATAKEACLTSYSPYSHFKVGCSIMLEDGSFITGSNQENVAYPSGLCAERVALFQARATHPNVPIKAMCIAAFYDGAYTSDPVTPCGSCRQVMLEYASQQAEPIMLLLYGMQKIYRIHDVCDLLPICFHSF